MSVVCKSFCSFIKSVYSSVFCTYPEVALFIFCYCVDAIITYAIGIAWLIFITGEITSLLIYENSSVLVYPVMCRQTHESPRLFLTSWSWKEMSGQIWFIRVLRSIGRATNICILAKIMAFCREHFSQWFKRTPFSIGKILTLIVFVSLYFAWRLYPEPSFFISKQNLFSE